MAQSFTPWQARDYPGGTAPFRVAETFGPAPRGHDYLDNVRMYWRRTPESSYPDGYLGTINTRRGDRLLDSLKQRQTNRPYTRGIHKGERIDPTDYEWPAEFNLFSGLQQELEGHRFISEGMSEFLPDERYPTDHMGVGPRSVPVGNRYVWTGGGPAPQVDPDRFPVLKSQAPPWSSGGPRGNPGMAVPYPGR